MLLNEMQKRDAAQATINAEQIGRIAVQDAEIRELKEQQKRFATQAEVQDLKQQLQELVVAWCADRSDDSNSFSF
jgi:hypothetical protein